MRLLFDDEKDGRFVLWIVAILVVGNIIIAFIQVIK